MSEQNPTGKGDVMEWGNTETSMGVTERDFSISCNGRAVPGVLWSPQHAVAPTPLVLIGHGGSGHKREAHLISLARRFVRHNGIAAATIDGPAHGNRKPAGTDNESVAERRRRFIGDRVTDMMVEDWKATLDALQKLPEIGVGRVGYWGLSMGTMFGLPLVAAEPRIEVAVLGLMGTAIGTGSRLRADAADVQCPVLFLQQWDDQLIPRESASELFGALATQDKRLHANPGLHSAIPREEFLGTQTFLARHLSAAAD
jgi:dienelactone hydrolase